jgi:hypothetical protein
MAGELRSLQPEAQMHNADTAAYTLVLLLTGYPSK